MPSAPVSKEILDRALDIKQSFRVSDGLYLVGSLEKGVTVYKQQVRAHNLVWALWQLEKAEAEVASSPKTIAVVGGGIAGLTVAGCFLSLFSNSQVTVFEKLWDLCPLQQGADNRWLHPRIYDWPTVESRRPHAALPVLDWSEGRASDVARTVVSGFARIANEFDSPKTRLNVFVGLGHLRISACTREIDWVGHKTDRNDDSFFGIGTSEGKSEKFDIIVLACGFGLEAQVQAFPTASYWRNEQIGQPHLDGSRQAFLISGFGDGALVDLFRLTIERFRQDTILDEIFASNLEKVESYFAELWPESKWNQNVFSVFEQSWVDWLAEPARRLSHRLRKDTQVVLHIKGKSNDVKSFGYIFGRFSSFLSRLLTYLLYRCGAFGISFDELTKAVLYHRVPEGNVLCRYGADVRGHLSSIFNDFDSIANRLDELKESQPQRPKLLWQPGTIPIFKESEPS